MAILITDLKTKNGKPQFTPRKIKLVASKEKLTNAAGLGTMVEAFDESPLALKFADCLPERLSNRSKGSYRLGLIQLSSFLYGHDCIDDLIEFRQDPMLEAVMKGETVLPRTMGNFLRDFSTANIESLNKFLPLQAKSYLSSLKNLHPESLFFKETLCLDIDSTPHEQRGQKMEGLAWNYKDMWCLDSQVIFDQFEHCWGFDLRSGNTKSGVGAGEMIKNALSGFKFRDEKQIRADSAYCNQEVIKTCLGLGVDFTITANQATTSWRDQIPSITNWEECTTNKEVHYGSFLWTPSWNESLRLQVVVKREVVDDEQRDLFDDVYKYYGVVTNMSLFKKTRQSIMEHHQKRGNAENFIREEKYGYDLKHFPCQKIDANRAFGLIAMVAHNLLRWMSLIDDPKKTKFAKKFRRKFIKIPGKLVSHARKLVLRVPVQFLKEVQRIRLALQLEPCPAYGST